MFNFENYLDVLNHEIKENQQVKGYKAALARAAGFEPSYLSKVLKGQAHLTPDHAYAIGKFWQLDELELEFFLLLVQWSRSGSRQLKNRLRQKMAALREKRNDFKQRLGGKSLASPAAETVYYSSWVHSAVHMLSALPAYQNVESLSKRLQVSGEEILSALTELEAIGLVTRHGKKWQKVRGNLHLPKSSRLTRLNHLNWRLRALEKTHQPDSLHFTSLYSLSGDTYEKIQETLLTTCQRIDSQVFPSAEEDVAVVCLDYFRC